MTAKTTRKTGGRSRRTKGAGGIIHRADGRWEFRREIDRDPATGKRRFIAASGRTKADAREWFGAKVAEMERTGLLPGAKSPYLKDYAERWLEEYRLNVKPTTYRTRAGRIHACMEVIGCIRLTDLTPDHIVFRQVGVSCLVMYFFRVGAGAVLLDSSLIPSPPIMPQDRARVDDP